MSEKTIWDGLRSMGFSKNATASLMGNIKAESNYFAPIVQGDFTAGYTKSILYTSQVDNGVISRNDFIHNGPGGGGYGLVQWTFYTRKAGLYDKAMQSRRSVGDETLQLEYLNEELHQAEYSSVLQTLLTDTSIEEMTKVVLRKFERPAIQDDTELKKRKNYAEEVLRKFSNDDYDEGQIEIPDQPEPEAPAQTHPIETCITEHRINYIGDVGKDVLMLQTALADMGYWLGEYGCDGAFGGDTETALKKMQADCNIRIDGIAGEETWQILFQ